MKPRPFGLLRSYPQKKYHTPPEKVINRFRAEFSGIFVSMLCAISLRRRCQVSYAGLMDEVYFFR